MTIFFFRVCKHDVEVENHIIDSQRHDYIVCKWCCIMYSFTVICPFMVYMLLYYEISLNEHLFYIFHQYYT